MPERTKNHEISDLKETALTTAPGPPLSNRANHLPANND